MRSPLRLLKSDLQVAAHRWRDLAGPPALRDVVPRLSVPATLLFAGVLGVWLDTVTRGLYRREAFFLDLCRRGERSPTEIATALLFLLAGGALLVWSVRAFRRSDDAGLRRWWLLAFGLGCLLVAGEESSWGQHLLGYDTPEILAAQNVQEEFNLHNMRVPGLGAYWAVRAHWWLVAGLGAVLPLLLVAWPWLRRGLQALEAPVPPWLTMATCFAAAFLMPTDPDLYGLWGPPHNVASEMCEFTLALALLPWVWSLRAVQIRRTVME